MTTPYYLGTVAGIALYECPKHGDEAPMLARVGGNYFSTCFYDMPDEGEMQDWLDTYHSA